MNLILDVCLVPLVIFTISLSVLIFNQVFHLVSFFRICQLFIQSCYFLWQWFSFVHYILLPLHIGRGKLLIIVFPVTFLFYHSFCLVLLFLFFVVVLAKNRIIIVSFPIFVENIGSFIILLLLSPIFMIFLINSCHNIKLFFILLDDVFLSFKGQSDLSVLEMKLR